MIRHEGSKWILYTRDGKRKLGTHGSKADALAQERAVEASKHGKGIDAGILEKAKRPLRAQDIHHGKPVPNPRYSFGRENAENRVGIQHKAGEVMIGMFPSRRMYPSVPTPNSRRRIDRNGKKVTFVKDVDEKQILKQDVWPIRETSPKQGLRSKPIDQTVDTGVATRATLGQEANEEHRLNPPAHRDPNPWRAPAAKPRSPSPMSRVRLNVPDGGLGMEPGGLKDDDVRRSIRGIGRPLGLTQRYEAAEPSNLADPSGYRRKKDEGWDGVVTK